jgi:hypothetical protein
MLVNDLLKLMDMWTAVKLFPKTMACITLGKQVFSKVIHTVFGCPHSPQAQ